MITSNNLSVDFVCAVIMVGGICLFKNQWGYICRGIHIHTIHIIFFRFLKIFYKVKKCPFSVNNILNTKNGHFWGGNINAQKKRCINTPLKI
mgnify:CR=1 FL=1